MSRIDQTDRTRAVVLDYLDALQRGDVATLRESFAPDATWSLRGGLPVSGTWTGPDAIIDEFLAAMMARLDSRRPLSQELTGLVVEGDTAVAEWTSRATTTSGEAYENDYAVVFVVTGFEIVAVREYFDTEYAGRVLFGGGDAA
jgi:ketosteroid isomerase-like protein